MNYNDQMANTIIPQVRLWAAEMADGNSEWSVSDAPYAMERDFVFPEYDISGRVKIAADYSHYEVTISNPADGWKHFEVQAYDGYTVGRSFTYRTSGDDAVDTVEIVSTQDWTFTKTVRFFNFDNVMNADGNAHLVSFAGINRNDGNQRVLGVLRQDVIPYDTADYTFDNPTSVIGAFDATQLAIRPDARPTVPYDLWWNTYPESGVDDNGIELFGIQGETFDHSLFATVSDVESLLGVGINVTDVHDWQINADHSRNYEFPEWTPESVGFTGFTP